jgi:hypothetical protein
MTVFGGEEFNEHIRRTVSDGGVFDKLLRRGQNNAQLHHLLYAIQVAKMLLRDRQGGHRRNPYRLAALLDREVFKALFARASSGSGLLAVSEAPGQLAIAYRKAR